MIIDFPGLASAGAAERGVIQLKSGSVCNNMSYRNHVTQGWVFHKGCPGAV